MIARTSLIEAVIVVSKEWAGRKTNHPQKQKKER
jgi:hypothetical protein